MRKKKIFKPFAFIFENIDSSSSNEKPFLPVFITETISDVYFSQEQGSKKEYIRASKTSGVENLTITQFLGDMYQNTNVYGNFIPMFGKSFVSPISGMGLLYYRYYLVDSAFLSNKWCYKVTFKPRRKQELTFTGEMWIHDTTFAVRKINMHIAPDANINFVNDIALVKEYERYQGKYWMLSKDILVVDFVTRENGLGFIGRKTASYRKVEVNVPISPDIFSTGQRVVTDESAFNRSAEYWRESRHDSLERREKKIYSMVDTIKTIPVYKTYVEVITMIVSGYKTTGKIDIGPYFNFYSFNPVEGHRFRLGMRTNNIFSPVLGLNGYIAYGTTDLRFKYGVGIDYLITVKPRQLLSFNYSRDVEQLGNSKNGFQEKNLLTSLLRRIPSDKFTDLEEKRITFEREWFVGLSTQLGLSHTRISPLGSLDYSYYVNENRDVARNFIVTSEALFSIRFAYQERIISSRNLRRVSLGSRYPVFVFSYILGLKDFVSSEFNYHKFILRVNHKLRLPPFGYTKYQIEGGKILGTLPFPLLEVHNGNEAYTYDNRAFNMMNYYEFVSDTYVGTFVTHHFDGFFLDKIPLMRKLKWREVVSARTVIGRLSDENRGILVNPNSFYTLENPYLETGLGIENILKVIRVDAIWRLTHLENPNIARFGIRANLQVTF
jgi:hypothetical protein